MAESSVYETMLTMGSGTVEYEIKGVILLNNTEEITLSWGVAQGDERGVVEWVKKNRLFVKDSQVTTEIILDGIWRSSNYWLFPGVSRDKPPKFVQTFRKGLATTADDKEAYIYSEGDSSVVDDNTYTVMFPNVSPVKLDTVIGLLKVRTTVTNPTYGHTKLTGKFVYGSIQGGPEKDGAHNITVTLKRVVPLTAPIEEDLASRKKLIDSGKTIIADGAIENGVKQWKDFVWQGLDPDDEAVCLDIDVPTFVDKNIEDVNAWSGTSVVGSLYTWNVDDSVEDWVDHRRTRVVEARKAFDMDEVTARVAMESGYVTEAWEVVLPITFGTQKDGTAVLQIHAENKKWENIIVGDDPTTASFLKYSISNDNGYGASKVEIAKGIPTSSILEVMENIASEAGYLISGVSMQESGEVSSLQVNKRKTFNYITDDVIDDPKTQTNISDANGAVKGQINVWPRIDPSEKDDHITVASAYTDDYSSGMKYSKAVVQEQDDGAFNIVVYLTDERSGGASDDDDRAWSLRRSHPETTANPSSVGTSWELERDGILKRPTADDGYFWRIVWEQIDCKITLTPSSAENWAKHDGGNTLPGGFSRPYRAGMFYAEKVVWRGWTKWYADSIKALPASALATNLTEQSAT